MSEQTSPNEADSSRMCPMCRREFAPAAPIVPRPGEAGAITLGPEELAALEASLPTGSLGRIGRFEIEAELGEGAFGKVYRAYDPSLKRRVALKVPREGRFSSAERAERFLREARTAANLQHPNIVAVFDSGEEDGRHYIASSFVQGCSLDRVLAALNQGRTLPLPEAVQISRKLAEALGYAHKSGVIHRDVKPANVMLREDGEPMLMDFGLAARAGEAQLTQAGQLLGTPAYMAPEQWHGKAEPASDQYGLGCLIFELLTGQAPFAARGGDIEHYLVLHLHTPALSPRTFQPNLPRDLVTICLKCLEKEPARRYADCQALADDLRRFQQSEPVQARRAGIAERLAKWSRRNPALAAMTAVALLFLVLGASVSAGLAVYALGEAKEAKRLAEDEKVALARATESERKARTSEAKAKENESKAKWNERLARDANHAIQIDLALRARERGDYDRMAAVLTDMRSEYLDAWETRHVRGLWVRHAFPLRSLIGHTGVLYSVAWSPDGKRVLTRSADKTVRLWDAETGQEKAILKGHTDKVFSAVWGLDGKSVLTGSADKTARLWDAQTGQEKVTLKGHAGEVVSVAFSPDGKRVLTGSADKTARVWSAETGQEKATFKKHTGLVNSVAWSPDGKRVLTGSWDKTARVWDAETGQEEAILTGHTHEVTKVAWGPDGKRLLTGSWDRTARVWDAETGQKMALLEGHAGFVSSVAWSPDGKCVLTGSQDNTSRVWDAVTGQVKAFLQGHTREVATVAWSPDGKRILTGSTDTTARVWDAETGKEKAILKVHTDVVASVAFSPDGKRILTGSHDNTARVWGAETRNVTVS